MYYQLVYSLDPRQIGKGSFPQTEGIYQRSVDDPNYIHNLFADFEKIDREVIVPMAKLRQKSTKLTDLLSNSGYGFGVNRLLISDKLKSIIESSRYVGFQFLDTKVFDFFAEKQFAYWLSNVYLFCPEYVDYSKSEFWTETIDGKEKERVYCAYPEDYLRKLNSLAPRTITINKVHFEESKIEYDFFALRNVNSVPGYYVSDKLKREIEIAGCTGISFIRPEDTYP